MWLHLKKLYTKKKESGPLRGGGDASDAPLDPSICIVVILNMTVSFPPTIRRISLIPICTSRFSFILLFNRYCTTIINETSLTDVMYVSFWKTGNQPLENEPLAQSIPLNLNRKYVKSLFELHNDSNFQVFES